jgi:hypothetical protein
MKIIINVILLLFIVSASKAQIGPAEVTKTSVGLYNLENSDVRILLGKDRMSLDTFIIRKGSLWYSGYYEKSPIFIIKTGIVQKAYTLGLNNYYLIFYDSKKKYWDLRLTTKRGSR